MKNKIYLLSVENQNEVIKLEIEHTVIEQEDDNMLVTVSAVIQGNQVTFQEETTEDALIQLARNLPETWSMKSCLSCRYGHFCPVGNYDNEVFCVTDFDPKSPRDLWHVTEDYEERIKRSHTLFDLCDRYMPQSEDYYTYSDYYFEIKNAKAKE